MKQLFLLFLLSAFLFSCSNEFEEIKTQENTDELLSGQTQFTYKGKIYSSNYEIVNSVFVYENKEVDELLTSLYENPTLAAYVGENGDMEYFDNIEEMKAIKEKEISVTRAISTRAFPFPANRGVTFYEYPNYERASITYGPVEEALGRIPKWWNDNFSSLATNSCSVTLYRDKDFTGASITFGYNICVPDLRAYQCSKHRTWDNQASSFRIHYYY